MNRLEKWIRNFTRRQTSARRRFLKTASSNCSTPASVLVENLEKRLLLTFNIVFDYTYDSSGFLNPQARRDVLETAASVYESRITDDLTAISPSGSNTWTAVFNNPSTNTQVNRSNLNVPADTIIVYVGARNLTSGLGLGGPGGFSAFATPAFVANLQTRGETGVDPNSTNDTDYALWGGTIAFDNASTWNFSLDPPTTGQNDFYSVALHELGHILGLGTAESFENKINGSKQFIGAKSVATFGGPIPMNTDQFGNLDDGHFAPNTQSTLPGTSTTQEVALDPQLTTGTRKYLTDLDWAAIDDLGWDVTAVAGPTDYGDAPDATSGTGAGNYQTRSVDNGPRHAIVNGLKIGAIVEGDDGSLQNANATADDTSGTDDEDFNLSDSLFLVQGAAGSIKVNVTNTIGSAATLYGWVDFNRNGVFENSERSSVAVSNGTNNGTVTLNFGAPAIGTAGNTFARFRLSTDAAAAAPTGAAANGEVEDHAITILTQTVAYDSLPSFNWSATSGAVRYEVEVNNLTTGLSQVILQSQLTATTFRPHEALPAGIYSWRYRPHNGTAFLPFSDPVSFAILETSSNPFITDPVGSSVDSRPTVAWSPVALATRYELWVNGVNKERIIHQSNLSTTSFTPLTGLPADAYTAWVRAFNGASALGTWSPAFSFTLATSATSVLTDPVASSTNTAPVFSWLPMNVASYALKVDNLSTGVNDIIEASNLTGTSYTPGEGLAPGNYVAYITGFGTARSAGVNFQVSEVTGQVQFANPSSRSENPLPVFSWTSVAGATRYELWVEDSMNGQKLVIHDSNIADTVFTTTEALPSSTYRAWVRAYSGTVAVGTWSTPIDYVVLDSAAVPTIWAPVDSTLNTAPIFVWSSTASATHYELDINQNGVLQQTQQNIVTNTLSLQSSLPIGTYSSTVRAYNGATLLSTDTRGFTVTTTTGPLELFSPGESTDSTRPTFSWTTIDTATRYILWLNDDTRSINAAILENNIQTPSFTPASPLLPGNYRVWLRAYNAATPVGSWSFATKFTVTESTDPPSITAPLPNSTNSIPTITWTAITAAASYEIQIDDITNSQSGFITSQGIATTAFRPSTPLNPGLYQVRVRSVNLAGTPSAWSDDFSMIIEAATSASLVSPLVSSSSSAASVLFAWTTVANTARYELWVNNQSTGTNKVIDETALTDISFTPATLLAAGNYRAWIRAIGTDTNLGAWSSGVDFTVAATSPSLKKQDSDVPTFADIKIQLANLALSHTEAAAATKNASATLIGQQEMGGADSDSQKQHERLPEELIDVWLSDAIAALTDV